MRQTYGRLKAACYMTNTTMAVVGNLPPLLFLGFRTMYGLSYSLLGLLVLVNFVTQLTIDLIFSFFSHKFNIPKTVKCIPVLGVLGFVFYAVWPYLFPAHVYAGLLIGTVIFSGACGLAEVLISPVIAAIPSPDPDREMSKLHAMYAWGAVGVILLSTVFLMLCGKELWQILVLIFTLIPLIAFVLFAGADIPQMETPERVSGALRFFRNKQLYVCVAAIFLGGAAECTMAAWCSGYVELTLGVPKIWGDIGGAALFAVMLGLGRTLYAKCGKHIERVMLWGAVGATACYILSAVTDIAVLGLLACGLTGICVSMMWPGSLIVASERFPHAGVFIYAMMAAGGDLGAAVGPQMVGVLTDTLMVSPVAAGLSISPEQFAMKCSMLAGALFPLIGIAVFAYIKSSRK